ncbi:MAG: penicillin-binding protein 2 [Rickettsiales bacterium]|jgi:penicillin-binding protein 2|nr:penicillin-binding protein 2 [Rickettsiales bacterium]
MSSLLEEHIKGSTFIRRLFIIVGFQFAAVLILILRLFYLQILNFDNYRSKSENNRINISIIPPLRGNIFDRNNNALTNNRNGYELILYKDKKQKDEDFVNKITNILDLNEEKQSRMRKQLKNNKHKPVISVLNNLTWEELVKIEANNHKIKNISTEEGYIREYLYGKEFAHILGYVAIPNDKDITKLSGVVQKDILMHPNFKIGKNGLESSFNSILTGESGYKKIEVNAYGVPMRELEQKEAKVGKNIKLTIDLRLQNYIHKIVENMGAGVVVLDVKTGEILAMVSTPSFETNEFIDGISNKYWSELINDERKPMYNKIISATYPMGSTFKPIVSIAALENGWDENKKVNCTGSMPVTKNTVFRCWKKHGHGQLNILEALERSCNIFFANLGLFTGVNNIHDVAMKLGIGEVFDVNLAGYNRGILPSAEWKKEIYGKSWTKGDTINMSIGQGFILANPLQMAVMVSRIANGGYQIKPFLIYDSQLRSYNENLYLSEPMFREKSINITKLGMFNVINGKHGTASGLKDDKYLMAGKTGTVQVVSLDAMSRLIQSLEEDGKLEDKFKNHSIFVGFAPFNSPKYGIAVVIEHGGSGSGRAASIAKGILKFAVDSEI